MTLLGLNHDLTADQRIIYVAISAMIGIYGEDASQLTASRENHVQLVPPFGAGMSPRYFVFCGFIWKKYVSNAQIVECA